MLSYWSCGGFARVGVAALILQLASGVAQGRTVPEAVPSGAAAGPATLLDEAYRQKASGDLEGAARSFRRAQAAGADAQRVALEVGYLARGRGALGDAPGAVRQRGRGTRPGAGGAGAARARRAARSGSRPSSTPMRRAGSAPAATSPPTSSHRARARVPAPYPRPRPPALRLRPGHPRHRLARARRQRRPRHLRRRLRADRRRAAAAARPAAPGAVLPGRAGLQPAGRRPAGARARPARRRLLRGRERRLPPRPGRRLAPLVLLGPLRRGRSTSAASATTSSALPGPTLASATW